MTVPMRPTENLASVRFARRSRAPFEPLMKRLTVSKIEERLAALEEGVTVTVASRMARFSRSRERFLGFETTAGRPEERRRRLTGDEGTAPRDRLVLGLGTMGGRPS